tara:strand:- start:2397 stop:3164 length:768 start_codon:yes stop_codon:yes gene_type:complete
MSKNARGVQYRTNVWRIVSEFEDHESYETTSGLDIDDFFASDEFKDRIAEEGIEFVDKSDCFEPVKHSLQLIETLAKCVHEARRKLVVVRRTPENNGPVLMLQRQNFEQGLVSEEAPLSFLAMYKDQKLLLTQDIVPGKSTLSRMLLNLVENDDTCAVCGGLLRDSQSTTLACQHEIHTECLLSMLEKSKSGEKAQCPECTNPRLKITKKRTADDDASSALEELKFQTQMRAIAALMEAAGLEPTDATCVEKEID